MLREALTRCRVNKFGRAPEHAALPQRPGVGQTAPVLAFLLYPVLCGILGLLVRIGVDDRDLEIAVLRHQLRILSRRGRRPRYRAADRALLAAASRFFPRERWSALPVTPDNLTRWRRQLLSRRRSNRRRPGRPPIDPEVRELILRMGRENPRWGYLRIKGELLKLAVSATTIANVLRRGGLGRPLGGSDRPGPSSCGSRPWPSWPPAVHQAPANRIEAGQARTPPARDSGDRPFFQKGVVPGRRSCRCCPHRWFRARSGAPRHSETESTGPDAGCAVVPPWWHAPSRQTGPRPASLADWRDRRDWARVCASRLNPGAASSSARFEPRPPTFAGPRSMFRLGPELEAGA